MYEQYEENHIIDDDYSDAETISPISSEEEQSEEHEQSSSELEYKNREEYSDHVTLNMLLTYLPKIDVQIDPVIDDWVLITPMRRSILLDPLIEWWERKPCALHHTRKPKKSRKRKRRKFVKERGPKRWQLTMLLKSSLASNIPVLEESELRNGEQEKDNDIRIVITNKLSSKHKPMLESSHPLNISTKRSQPTQELVSMTSVKLAPLSVIRARYCKRQRIKCHKEKKIFNSKSSYLLYLHTRTGLLTPSAPPCFGGNNFVETLIEMTIPTKNVNDEENTNSLAKSKKEKELCTSLDTSELVSTNTNAQLQLGTKRTRCDGHANVRYERV